MNLVIVYINITKMTEKVSNYYKQVINKIVSIFYKNKQKVLP